MCAERSRFVDGRRMVDPANDRPRFRSDFRIAASAAAGIEHPQPSKRSTGNSGFRLESRAVLVVVSHVVGVPLSAEAGQMLLPDKAGNSADDRNARPAAAVKPLLAARDRAISVRGKAAGAGGAPQLVDERLVYRSASRFSHKRYCFERNRQNSTVIRSSASSVLGKIFRAAPNPIGSASVRRGSR